jgi:hypothetical protein
MTRRLKDKRATLVPARRATIEAEADRLHAEYRQQEERRTTNRPTKRKLSRSAPTISPLSKVGAAG